MVDGDRAVTKTQFLQHIGNGIQHLGFGNLRPGTGDVHVALVELPKSSLGRPVRTPHRLDLVTLEEAGQLVIVLRHHPRQRHSQIVPQSQLRETGLLHFLLAQGACQFVAAVENAVQQLVAFVPVLAQQGSQILHRRGFQGQETVPLEHSFCFVDDVATPANRVG